MPIATDNGKIIISSNKVGTSCDCYREFVDVFYWIYDTSKPPAQWRGPFIDENQPCENYSPSWYNKYVWQASQPCKIYWVTACGCGDKDIPDPVPKDAEIVDIINDDPNLDINEILDQCIGCGAGVAERYVFEWVYNPAGAEWIGPTYVDNIGVEGVDSFPDSEWVENYFDEPTGCKLHWISRSLCIKGDPANDVQPPPIEQSTINLGDIEAACAGCATDTYKRFAFAYDYNCNTDTWDGPTREQSMDGLDCSPSQLDGEWLTLTRNPEDFCRIVYRSECLCEDTDPDTIIVPPIGFAVDEEGDPIDLDQFAKFCCCDPDGGNMVRAGFVYTAEEPDEPNFFKWNFDRVTYTADCGSTSEGEIVLPTEANPCELTVYGTCYCDNDLPSPAPTPPDIDLTGISTELCFPGGVPCDPLRIWRIGTRATPRARTLLTDQWFYNTRTCNIWVGYADDIHGASNNGRMTFQYWKVRCENGVWAEVSGTRKSFTVDANQSAWALASNPPLEVTDGVSTGWRIVCSSGEISFAERQPDYCPGHTVKCDEFDKGGCRTTGAIRPANVPRSLEYQPVAYLKAFNN